MYSWQAIMVTTKGNHYLSEIKQTIKTSNQPVTATIHLLLQSAIDRIIVGNLTVL